MFQFGNEKTNICFIEKENVLYIQSISFFDKEYVRYEQGIPHSYVFLVGEYYPSKKLFNRYGSIGEKLTFVTSSENRFENKKILISSFSKYISSFSSILLK